MADNAVSSLRESLYASAKRTSLSPASLRTLDALTATNSNLSPRPKSPHRSSPSSASIGGGGGGGGAEDIEVATDGGSTSEALDQATTSSRLSQSKNDDGRLLRYSGKLHVGRWRRRIASLTSSNALLGETPPVRSFRA